MARFTERFFTNFDQLLGNTYHESWGEIEITRETPGLDRHWAAEDALKKLKPFVGWLRQHHVGSHQAWDR